MPVNNSLSLDVITLEFINPVTGQTVSTITDNNISNATSINMERDFFTPSDGLTFVIEDDRAIEFSKFMQRGWMVKVIINGKQNMIGYIFKYHLSYGKDSGGTKLVVECKDLLEYLAQGTCYPNQGLGQQGFITNVHFPATNTLKQCLQSIAASFYNAQQGSISANKNNILQIVGDQSNDLVVGSGFKFGTKVKGKVSAKNLSTAMNHLTTPLKGESYLAYMLRLSKLAGAHLKASNIDPNTIICTAPSYDSNPSSPFQIWHCHDAPNNQYNNVKYGDITYNLDHQPSVVIVETDTTSGGEFYMQAAKGVARNVLTAVQNVTSSPSGYNVTYIPSVNFAIANLTSGTSGNTYQIMPFNNDLYQQIANMTVGISTNFSLPYYTVSSNAHTSEEAKFGASEYLADCQDKYVELTYTVQGWTMPGTNYVWQPNMMCMVTDDILFSNSAQKPFPMWIRKVNFTKDRNLGTYTTVHLTLPFTHPIATYDNPKSNTSSLPAAVASTNPTTPTIAVEPNFTNDQGEDVFIP